MNPIIYATIFCTLMMFLFISLSIYCYKKEKYFLSVRHAFTAGFNFGLALMSWVMMDLITKYYGVI